MKNTIPIPEAYSSSSSPPDLRHDLLLLKPKRKVLKKCTAKRIKPNSNDNDNVIINDDPFTNSDGYSWFRGSLLGQGGFASVFVAQINQDFCFPHQQIAVKSSLLEHASSLKFEKKVLLHIHLKSCPNVVECFGGEVSVNQSGKQVYNLLLEYCPGGDLYNRILNSPGPNAGLPELEVRRYTSDIVNGLVSIQGSGYIHCDIKPENILLVRSGTVGRLVAKIADFGLAMELTKVGTIDEEDPIRGTKQYLAPELVTDNYPDWPIDIWALGCVVLEMLTGEGAWGSKATDPDLLNHIGYGNQLPEIPSGLSSVAIDFLRRCLIRNPLKRSSAWSLLSHPFINSDFY